MPAEHDPRKFISNLYSGGIVVAQYHINGSGELLFRMRNMYTLACAMCVRVSAT